MKIKLVVVGKSDRKELINWLDEYQKRLKHYIDFSIEVIPSIKKTKHLSSQEQKNKEGVLIFNKLLTTDHCILLDEKGHEYTSEGFADFLQRK